MSIMVIPSCVVSKINPRATNNETQAKQAILDVQKNGIVVIFPTDYQKERVLRNISNSRPQVQHEIQKIKDRRTNRWNIWQSEIKNYTFSDLSIVPDSLLKSYIENPTNITSINKEGKSQQIELNDIYVLYTEFGGFDVKKNGTFIPNPFPNQVKPSKWASIRDFLGVQGDEKSINSFFTELNANFMRYAELSNTSN